MKKLYLLVLTIITFNTSYSQIRFGIKGGLNLSTIEETFLDIKAKSGIFAGAFVNVKFTDRIFLQPEILYSSKGGKFAQSSPTKTSINLTYINLPILAGINFSNVTLLVGPEFGYLLNSSFKSGDIKNNITDRFNKYDIGISLGADYRFFKHIGLNLRYNHGLSYQESIIYTDPNGNTTGEKPFGKNRNFQLGLFYLL
jgi:hypothetical protein